MELSLILLAAGAGLSVERAALLLGVLFVPLPLLGLVGFVVYRSLGEGDLDAAIFCEATAAELRSGSNLRDAMLSSLPPDRIPMAYLSTPEIGSEAARLYPGVGPEIEATVKSAHQGGSRVADLFDEIGALALAQAEIVREVRVATAPARVTSALFLFAPVVFLVIQVQSGGIENLIADPRQKLMVAVGLALFLSGLVAAAAMVWRAR